MSEKHALRWQNLPRERSRVPVDEKEVKGSDSAVPNNDEISPGLSWRLIRAARYPLNPPSIAQFLRGAIG